MSQRSPTVAGDLLKWPTKERMSEVLSEAGLSVTVGRFSIRIDGCSHFVFQEYGGDLGEPSVDADAASVAELLRDAELVSTALSRSGLVHKFEVHDEDGVLVGYFHYGWPKTFEL